MLQARSMGTEGDKRWYSPDRDLVHLFPKLIGQALRYLFKDDYQVKELTPEEFGKECQRLARILNQCQTGEIVPDKVAEEYLLIHPKVRELLSAAFFVTLLGAYRVWCADVRPREPGDARLTVEEMEREIDAFLDRCKGGQANA